MINEANCGKFVKTTNPVDVENTAVDIVYMGNSKRIKLGKNGKIWIYAHRQHSTLAKDCIDEIDKKLSYSRFPISKNQTHYQRNKNGY